MVILSLSAFTPAQDGPCPCCAPEQRQFDFWLGEWKVYVNDTLSGTNSIRLAHDSCVLIEQWSSAGGVFTGTSYNFFNRTDKTGHQTWIDNQGGHLLLNGQLKDGSMVLTSEPSMNQKGEPVLNRITWTPDRKGRVRQIWETSNNLG